MVMEAAPSPHSVGREFVRQYYTLLNKAPTHLHRFYNNHSSFVHGGLDPPHRETMPMVGQKQIHQKIQQLNFQDCHAKIAQVDAQATLGNGVVVQVTGELSNAGQPMRRFTQTFVLAAQSPKKYYVHNDIFRYQDEIISDEECENEQRSGDEDDINQERNEVPPINQQPIPYYNAPPAAPMTAVHHVMPQQQQPMPTVNGAVHQDEMMAGNIPQHISNAGIDTNPTMNQNQPVVTPSTPAVEIEQPAGILDVEESGAGTGAADASDSYDMQQGGLKNDADDIHGENISNEPKTYATLLKSGGGSYSYVSAGMNAVPPQPPKSASPPPQMKSESRENQGSGFQGGPPRNRGDNPRNNRNCLPRPRPDFKNVQPRNADEGNFYGEERRRSQGNFSDSNQLFLGNLPLAATEDDLRQVFAEFGTVVDLRIHSKPNKNGPPGSRATPNYGFITYETQEGVSQCLAAKPITWQGPDKSVPPTVLNVEEKKAKSSYGGGMRTSGGGGGMDNNLGPRIPRGDNNGGSRRGGPLSGSGGPGRGGPLGGGGPGLGGNRSNNFNRGGPPNRGGPNNTYNSRR